MLSHFSASYKGRKALAAEWPGFARPLSGFEKFLKLARRRRFLFSAFRHAKRTVPEDRGEPSGLTMIPMTSFVEKSDRAARFFVLRRSLRAALSRPSATGDPFLFLSTGAEYLLSVRPMG